MSNLSCLGFDVSNKEAFTQLLGRLSVAAKEELGLPPTQHLRWSDRSGAAIAFHLTENRTID